MSEWITDRKPTVEDAQNMAGAVWLAMPKGNDIYDTVPQHWTGVKIGDVWRPIVVPMYERSEAMSEWITDSEPNLQDADCDGYVWMAMPIGYDNFETVPEHWTNVKIGDAWCPIVVPIYKGAKP